MKRLTCLLVALLFASQAMALTVTCTNVDTTVTVGYSDANSLDLVRGFGLDIVVTGGKTYSNLVNHQAGDANDYYVYPGTIVIDAGGTVTDAGTPVAPIGAPGSVSDGSTAITIEMASLYAATDPNHSTPPGTSGDLVSFDVNGLGCTITVSASTLRGGIVLESGAADAANLPVVLVIPVGTYDLTTGVVGSGSVTGAGTYDSGTYAPIEALPDSGWEFDSWSGDHSGSTNPDTVLMDANKSVTATFLEKCYNGMADYAVWEAVGEPECWCYPRQCHGDADGEKYGSDRTGWYYVGLADILILAEAWEVMEPEFGDGIATVSYGGVPGACADFDHTKYGSDRTGWYYVGLADILILADTWEILEPEFDDGVPDDCSPGNRTP